MRIDAYNAVNQVYQANAKVKSSAAKAYTTADDQIEISESAKNYSTAKAAVTQASDVRADLVADIKARMASGTYQVSAGDIADRILSNQETIVF